VKRHLHPALATVALAACFLCTQTAGAAEPQQHDDEKKVDNGMCYVCHLTLEHEAITKIHLKEGYGCTECHGPSTEHMHDEMQMTTPDFLYGRREVEALCSKCHKDPHKGKQDKKRAFIERWQGKPRTNGRAVSEKSICTDCHGTHNIDKGLKAESKTEPEFTAAFNGKDLTGWKTAGQAQWKVRLGRIVGTPGATGGDLFSEEQLDDYLMAVTFRADWPIRAGIWLRGPKGPRVEIFEHDKPTAYTGTVGLPGKGLALLNLRKDLFDPGGWNTLSIEVRGPHATVWLNGEKIGAVACLTAEKGPIGVHLEGGPGYENAQLTVGEIQIQKLTK